MDELRRMAAAISNDTNIDKVFAGYKKIIPAFLVSAAILFQPKSIAELLGMNELSDNIRTINEVYMKFYLIHGLLIYSIKKQNSVNNNSRIITGVEERKEKKQ